ncbi:Hypothetical predicted protein [Xyrichtys novacula]|uniref:Uncharacterized protein n=1 Tax=Xyrichtys novacula TaxID=13765 RepID=A0AAV1GTN8_XYRNO|nr:Hypothetical predicted protein [Xyrichtys novacula]
MNHPLDHLHLYSETLQTVQLCECLSDDLNICLSCVTVSVFLTRPTSDFFNLFGIFQFHQQRCIMGFPVHAAARASSTSSSAQTDKQSGSLRSAVVLRLDQEVESVNRYE